MPATKAGRPFHTMMRVEIVDDAPTLRPMVECPACGALFDPLHGRWVRVGDATAFHGWSAQWQT